MGLFSHSKHDKNEEQPKQCHVCKNTLGRIYVWKLSDGKYICRFCRKKQEKSNREKHRSTLRDYKKRPDYVRDDFNTNDRSRISDLEFDKLIEEFEEAGWSETRDFGEYKKHEDYIHFLFRVEFQRRVKTQSHSHHKPEEQKIRKLQTSYYSILEVDRNASFDDIKESYKKLVIRWHPDKNKDDPILAESMFKKIREAYETLKDPEKKKKYDEQLE